MATWQLWESRVKYRGLKEKGSSSRRYLYLPNFEEYQEWPGLPKHSHSSPKARYMLWELKERLG